MISLDFVIPVQYSTSWSSKYILLRYYLKDLSVLKHHVEIDTRYTLAKTSFAHPIQSRRNPLGQGPPPTNFGRIRSKLDSIKWPCIIIINYLPPISSIVLATREPRFLWRCIYVCKVPKTNDKYGSFLLKYVLTFQKWTESNFVDIKRLKAP